MTAACLEPARLTADAGAMVTVTAGTLTADVGRRQITGRVVTYGTRATTSHGPTVFAPGSVRASSPEHVALLVEHDHARSVGYARSIAAAADGVDVTFYLPPGPAGDAALADAASGLRAGLSVGVELEQTGATRNAAGDLEVSVAALREVSLVSVPAWDTARVTSVAASAPTAPTYPAPTVGPPSLPSAPVIYTQAVAYAPPASNPGARSLTLAEACRLVEATRAGQMDKAEVYRALTRPPTRGEAQQMLTAALIDILPADDAGLGLLPPAWLGELWQASEVSRPLIDAITSKPLPATGLEVYGFAWVTRPTGGPYAGNKTAVPSGPAATGPLSAPVERWAGANDIDRVFFDRGAPGFVEAYFSALTVDYALDVEGIVSGKLQAAATPR